MNCTDAASLCEEDLGIFAMAGLCDASSGECLCSSGWGGDTGWDLYNACFVNEELLRTAWWVSLAVSALALCVSLSSMAFLMHRWEWIRLSQPCGRSSSSGAMASATNQERADVEPGRKTGTRATRPMRKMSQHAGAAANRMKQVVMNLEHHVRAARTPREVQRMEASKAKQIRRRRSTMVIVVGCVLYALSAGTYFALYLSGVRRFDKDWVLDVALCVTTAVIFCALWLFFQLWYSNLPALRIYSRLLGVDGMLIRRPRLVHYVVDFHIAAILLVYFVIIIGLPYFGEDMSEETRDTLNRVYFMWNGVLSLEWAVAILPLGLILRRLFTQMQRLSINSSRDGLLNDHDKLALEHAVRTIDIIIIATCILSPTTAACNMVALAVPQLLPWVHNLTLLFGNLATVILCHHFCVRQSTRPRKTKPVDHNDVVSESDTAVESSA